MKCSYAALGEQNKRDDYLETKIRSYRAIKIIKNRGYVLFGLEERLVAGNTNKNKEIDNDSKCQQVYKSQ